jgi:hypothetical protein
MGDMGQGHKHGGKKRIGTNGRRSRGKSDVLDWFSDRYRKPNAASQKITAYWLNKSFRLSNPEYDIKIPNDMVSDIATSMTEVASAIPGSSDCRVVISEPQNGDPYWESRVVMVINDVRHETVFASLDLNEMLTSSLAWINQKKVQI